MIQFISNKRIFLASLSKQWIGPAYLSSMATEKDKSMKTPAMKVFDRNAKLLQRERAAALPSHHVFDYLKEEVGYRLSERLLDVKKELKDGLDLGCGKGFVSKHILDTSLQTLTMGELSPRLLALAETPQGDSIQVRKEVMDEEGPLPIQDHSLDVVLSNLSLHWVNNLPGCLREVHRVLRKDGVFIGSMFGCDTLFELRSSLVLAELEREGGFASHISPFARVSDIGALLTQAGFSMLTIDADELVVGFPSAVELMLDLKGMAEGNAAIGRKLHLRRDTIAAAAAIYQEMYGDEGSIPATFQIIYMIGWKPDPTQAVSQSERGSASVSLKDLQRLNELVKDHGLEGRLKFMQEKDRGRGGGGEGEGEGKGKE